LPNQSVAAAEADAIAAKLTSAQMKSFVLASFFFVEAILNFSPEPFHSHRVYPIALFSP
jgi:hypothetical protein